MVFKSKIDTWLVAVAFGVPVVGIAIALNGAMRAHDFHPLYVAVPLLAIALAFIGWLFNRTDYRIESADLVIRSAFLRWTIPIHDIQSITPTRSPLSSPALSLDRLEILHRRGVVLVSPADKAGFIAALRAVNPRIVS
jgi:hypothetical protein